MDIEERKHRFRKEKPLSKEVLEERDRDLLTVVKNTSALVDGLTESLLDKGIYVENDQRLCFMSPTEDTDSSRVIVLQMNKEPNEVTLNAWETTYRILNNSLNDLILYKHATFKYRPKNLDDIEQLKRAMGIITLREQRRALGSIISLGNIRRYGWENGKRIHLSDPNGTDIVNEANEILLQVPSSQLFKILTP